MHACIDVCMYVCTYVCVYTNNKIHFSILLSFHILSYHIIPYLVISHHIISYHIVPFIPCDISCHILSCYFMSYHIRLYYIISYHIISYKCAYIYIHTCVCIQTARRQGLTLQVAGPKGVYRAACSTVLETVHPEPETLNCES